MSTVAQPKDPAVVVDGVVVAFAEWQEVEKIGGAAVFPPEEVVELAVVVGDTTAGHGARGVQRSQRPPLRLGRHPGRPSEVELTRGMEHDTVADHDGVEVGRPGQVDGIQAGCQRSVCALQLPRRRDGAPSCKLKYACLSLERRLPC